MPENEASQAQNPTDKTCEEAITNWIRTKDTLELGLEQYGQSLSFLETAQAIMESHFDKVDELLKQKLGPIEVSTEKLVECLKEHYKLIGAAEEKTKSLKSGKKTSFDVLMGEYACWRHVIMTAPPDQKVFFALGGIKLTEANTNMIKWLQETRKWGTEGDPDWVYYRNTDFKGDCERLCAHAKEQLERLGSWGTS